MKRLNGHKVVIEVDGNAFCAHGEDFINLQESPAGFGYDLEKAVFCYLEEAKL